MQNFIMFRVPNDGKSGYDSIRNTLRERASKFTNADTMKAARRLLLAPTSSFLAWRLAYFDERLSLKCSS